MEWIFSSGVTTLARRKNVVENVFGRWQFKIAAQFRCLAVRICIYIHFFSILVSSNPLGLKLIWPDLHSPQRLHLLSKCFQLKFFVGCRLIQFFSNLKVLVGKKYKTWFPIYRCSTYLKADHHYGSPKWRYNSIAIVCFLNYSYRKWAYQEPTIHLDIGGESR